MKLREYLLKEYYHRHFPNLDAQLSEAKPSPQEEEFYKACQLVHQQDKLIYSLVNKQRKMKMYSPEYMKIKKEINSHEEEKYPEIKKANKIIETFQSLCEAVSNWVAGDTEKSDGDDLIYYINLYFPNRKPYCKSGTAYKIWNYIGKERLDYEIIQKIISGKRKVKYQDRIASHSFTQSAIYAIANKYKIEDFFITKVKVTLENCFIYFPKLIPKLREMNNKLPSTIDKGNLPAQSRIDAEDEVLVQLNTNIPVKIIYYR